MRILDRSVYVGPSLYAHFPVIRLELDLGELEQWPTGRLGGAFVDGLEAALPGLVEHGAPLAREFHGEVGGYRKRTRVPPLEVGDLDSSGVEVHDVAAVRRELRVRLRAGRDGELPRDGRLRRHVVQGVRVHVHLPCG